MKKQITALLLGLAVLAMTVIGCGEAQNYKSADYGNEIEPAYERQDGGNYTANTDYSKNDDALQEKEGSTVQTEREIKLVYTCNMTMETLEYKKSVQAVRDLVAKYAGFVENEAEYDDAKNWYYSSYQKTAATMRATFTVRIPTKNYEAFLSDMEGNGKVTSRVSNVQNITKKYYETETTIKSLQIQEDRLLKMMEEAKDIVEMLEIEDRLTRVQTEIAQYKNTLASMDTDVDYSTVNLTIREVVEYTPEKDPEKTNTFGDRLKNTLKNTWEGFKEFGENFLFFLIEAGPYLLIFVAVPVIILIVILKNCKKKRAAKRAKAAEEKALAEAKMEVKNVEEKEN